MALSSARHNPSILSIRFPTMSAVTHSLTADDAKFRDDKPEVEHREGDATDSSPEPASFLDMEYDNDDQEPELHARTYVALAALFVLNYVQVFALNGPPSVVGHHSLTPEQKRADLGSHTA